MTTDEERYKAALERIASDLIGKAPSQVAREALTPVQEFEEVGIDRFLCYDHDWLQHVSGSCGVCGIPLIKPKVRIRKRIDIKGWADWRFKDGPEKAPLPWKRPIEFFAEWEE